MLLINGNLLKNNQLIQTNIRIEHQRITAIDPTLVALQDEAVIDCTGKIIVPGFIDVHVHLREPGGEHKETIETGTKAAARGGFTTICAMPNTNPVPENADILADLYERISKYAIVNVLPYASITQGLKGEQLVDFSALQQAGAFAFTDDGVGVQSADQMYQAMQQAAAINASIVAHTEDNSLLHGGVVHDGEVSRRLQLPGMTPLTESVQIARDVLLSQATNCHYHVCHVSSKESVRVIRDAKKAGIRVTAEVSPHHLTLDETDIVCDDANFKMNPPLRSSEDRQALIVGLLDGTLDCIATDHAPHAPHEKALGMRPAPFGIVGLEYAFQLLYTRFVLTGIFTLQQLVDWLTIRPATIFGLDLGRIDVGAFANITILDLNAQYTVDKTQFYSKSENTPFDKQTFQSDIAYTIVNGIVVYSA